MGGGRDDDGDAYGDDAGDVSGCDGDGDGGQGLLQLPFYCDKQRLWLV